MELLAVIIACIGIITTYVIALKYRLDHDEDWQKVWDEVKNK